MAVQNCIPKSERVGAPESKNPWSEYEDRKREFQQQYPTATHDQYEAFICTLCVELGL